MDPVNPRSGATGPRTAIGKRTASKNARTHGILSKDLTLNEAILRKRLSLGIAREMGANTFIKTELCRQVAFNLVERRRIEQYLDSEIQEANAKEAERRLSAAMAPKSFAVTAATPSADTSLLRVRATLTVSALIKLKDDVEKGVGGPREVSQTLNYLYRGSMTAFAKAMLSLCESAEIEFRRDPKEGNAAEKRQEWLASLRELLINEIAAMERMAEFEKALEQEKVVTSLSLSVLPNADVLDRADRLRTSNGRELVRLISLLKND
jgi:hypothetical protein